MQLLQDSHLMQLPGNHWFAYCFICFWFPSCFCSSVTESSVKPWPQSFKVFIRKEAKHNNGRKCVSLLLAEINFKLNGDPSYAYWRTCYITISVLKRQKMALKWWQSLCSWEKLYLKIFLSWMSWFWPMIYLQNEYSIQKYSKLLLVILCKI